MKILVNIVGKQTIDDQSDSNEFTTVGDLIENESQYIITYKELQPPPEMAVDVKVVVSKNKSLVEMVRTAQTQSQLLIERSKRNLCTYNTPYGTLLMGIFGKNIEVDFNGENGKFEFEYTIDFNGVAASNNKVIMSFKRN